MPFLPRKNSVGLFGGGKPDDDKEEDAGILAYAKDDNAVSADYRLGSLNDAVPLYLAGQKNSTK